MPLEEMDCLRTLYLGTYSLPGDTGDLHLPALYMHRCLQLQALSFENTPPCDLTVPDGCTVSMASDINTCLKVPATWHQATSARFSAAEHDGHLVTTCRFFSHVHQNLTRLEIHAIATTPQMDFAAAFPKLKHLSVTSVHGDCVMIVPTTLTSFELATDASPLIQTANIKALAESLCALRLAWSGWECKLDLLTAMELVGKPCAVSYLGNGDILALFGCMQQDACHCRACGACLSRTGILDPCLKPALRMCVVPNRSCL